MRNRFSVYGFLCNFIILRGLPLTVLALLVGERHFKIFKSYKCQQKISVDKCVQNDLK